MTAAIAAVYVQMRLWHRRWSGALRLLLQSCYTADVLTTADVAATAACARCVFKHVFMFDKLITQKLLSM